MPERRDAKCPKCHADAVALVCEEARVVWCESGHVVVAVGTWESVVFDFDKVPQSVWEEARRHAAAD